MGDFRLSKERFWEKSFFGRKEMVIFACHQVANKVVIMSYSKAVIAVTGISILEKANIFLPRSFKEAPM